MIIWNCACFDILNTPSTSIKCELAQHRNSENFVSASVWFVLHKIVCAKDTSYFLNYTWSFFSEYMVTSYAALSITPVLLSSFGILELSNYWKCADNSGNIVRFFTCLTRYHRALIHLNFLINCWFFIGVQKVLLEGTVKYK